MAIFPFVDFLLFIFLLPILSSVSLFTEVKHQNFKMKIKQLEAELMDLREEFECSIKMLKDGKAHSDMLEVVIQRERTQV